jgi:hypothetical protein
MEKENLFRETKETDVLFEKEKRSLKNSEWKGICAGVLSFAYIRIAVGDPVIKRGGLGSH